MQENLHTKDASTARIPAPASLALPKNGSQDATSSNISDNMDEDSAAVDFETYDVGEYHLTTCPICLEHFTLDNPAILLKCEHGFHLQCLESWRQRSSMCPMCFAPVVGDEGRLMSSSDVRRRRRIQRKPFAAVRHNSECSPLLSPTTAQLIQQLNRDAGRTSEQEEEIEVVEVTARECGVLWMWSRLRECCFF
ncbi:hypothetical protein JKF63_05380 [Porcisia hertigi]|uniref:RING-type E3 ubiquitin transferase n=1 Tax=Porcisia hertigi TaxID=2761500 RepID=A0A836ISJ8_9TRYP|nr:hypothetical protein JKF63_05380 [Porcisia hertigi]